jgi:L-threonylcarbamoyladenylate synthase
MNPIEEAVKILQEGRVVVYPTDTAYGLAVDATNVSAVEKLYQLKATGVSWQKLSAETGTMGVRLPNHQIALDLVKKFGKPITTTSANLSNKPLSYSVTDAKNQFATAGKQPDFYLDGGELEQTLPSTVVSLVEDAKILRVGPISETEIKKALENPDK